jgi:hypothetical protein
VQGAGPCFSTHLGPHLTQQDWGVSPHMSSTLGPSQKKVMLLFAPRSLTQALPHVFGWSPGCGAKPVNFLVKPIQFPSCSVLSSFSSWKN